MTAMTDHSTLDPTSLCQDQTYPRRYRHQSMYTDASISTVSYDERVAEIDKQENRYIIRNGFSFCKESS